MICNISMAQWSKTLIWRDRGPWRWVVLVNMECVQSSKTHADIPRVEENADGPEEVC